MKTMKRFLCVCLAVMMVLAMSASAFADTHAHKITINGNSGHTYSAYQVFDGDISDNKLTNIVWGTGVKAEDYDETTPDKDHLLTELRKIEAFKDCETAEDVAEVLQGFESDSAEAKAFAELVGRYVIKSAGVPSAEAVKGEGKSTYTISGLNDGYYIVMDTGSIPEGGSNTEYILEVVQNVTVNAKDGSLTAEKKVKDIDDTTGEESGWQDSADYDIGDLIPFQLKATLPDNYESYKTYSMTFHDYEMEYKAADGSTYAGLDLIMADSGHPFVVKVDGVAIDDSFYEVEMTSGDKCTFEVHIPNVKATPAKNNSVITVEYYSKLTAKANIGALGNQNKMFVTYTNDVYQGGEKGQTEEDVVIVFTYKAVVNKVDQDAKPLAGAGFTLEKLQKIEGKDKKDWTVIKTETIPAGETTTFTFTGLDDGEYRLTESTVPEGYNKMEDVYFTVTASHEILSDDPRLTALSGNVEDGIITLAGTPTDGTLSTTVENRQGATLPSTGGIGTTIFYVSGAVLVVGAAVLRNQKKNGC